MGCPPSTWKSELGCASVPKYPFERCQLTEGLVLSLQHTLCWMGLNPCPCSTWCHLEDVTVLPVFDLPG